MHTLILAVILVLSAFGFPDRAEADDGVLNVTVSYRERIALPPDAELDVQLLDISRADARAKLLSAQRFSMTGVPMSVQLNYDAAMIEDRARYAVRAEIWTEDKKMFQATTTLPALGGETPELDIVLMRVMTETEDTQRNRSITGVSWAVAEVAGVPWPNDDSATLTIDEEMRFSLFGGCNRFIGSVEAFDSRITFPEQFAGTLMACPDEIETAERSLLEALHSATRYVRFGGGLIFLDEHDVALLHFFERPE